MGDSTNFFANEINQYFTQAEQYLNEMRLGNLKPLQMKEREDKIESCFRSVISSLKQFSIFKREASRSEYPILEQKEREFQSRLQVMQSDLTRAKVSGREQLGLGTQRTIGGGAGATPNAPPSSAHGMLGLAHTIQDRTAEALAAAERGANETFDLGVKTNEELRKQRGQLEGIQKDMEEIDSVADRTKKVLGRMMKRLFADNIIKVLMIILLAGVLFLIIWQSVKGGSGGNNPANG
eukprot:gnl/Spiro4/24843_TR12353_c0_g1_i1.p1 gnl/Spiro4/24843_TR12353_c0_g1~~gnl/Spiro4/24843_TR12353_c0_g1_i1.p1  ORF type:complete len:237 (-),score=60.75 gnl/Spiro4/24843_TR12353_c0_g1_i1:188-898(-)